MRKRRLSDLYVRGKELSVDDNSGDPVVVWLQKINEIDRDSVLRRANAAKARFLIETDNEESEVFQAMYARVRDFGDREGLMSLIIAEDVAKARQRIESQAATNEDTWAKDGYLQGLLDSWVGDDDNPGLAATAEEDPEDEEVKRVKAELDRFDVEVAAEVRDEIATLEGEWKDRSDEELWRTAARKMLERESDAAFSREYNRQQLFYSVREAKDHARRYFATVAEVDDLDEQIRTYLSEQCAALNVEPTEGKGSRARDDSSNSSAPPEEISAVSGLAVVSA